MYLKLGRLYMGLEKHSAGISTLKKVTWPAELLHQALILKHSSFSVFLTKWTTANSYSTLLRGILRCLHWTKKSLLSKHKEPFNNFNGNCLIRNEYKFDHALDRAILQTHFSCYQKKFNKPRPRNHVHTCMLENVVTLYLFSQAMAIMEVAHGKNHLYLTELRKEIKKK